VPLGVSSAQRSALLPDTPTIAEAGIAGFEFTFWNGLWAPAATPRERVQRLNADITGVLQMPEVRERLASLGAEPMSMTPADFSRFVQREIEDSARIAQAPASGCSRTKVQYPAAGAPTIFSASNWEGSWR
jgi:tripartite-type tricarboxylate transporter receptor subunit TctC